MEEVSSVAFLTPKKNTRNTQLVGLHLSLPMGYINSAPYFCMATETVSNLTNEVIAQKEQAGEHPLELSPKAVGAD